MPSPRVVIEYEDASGKSLFGRYLEKLRDQDAKSKILTRIRRIETQGNFGDNKPVGENVRELRIHSGPGYRVYYGQDGEEVVVLLCAGDKDSQGSSISIAKSCWKDYKATKKKAS